MEKEDSGVDEDQEYCPQTFYSFSKNSQQTSPRNFLIMFWYIVWLCMVVWGLVKWRNYILCKTSLNKAARIVTSIPPRANRSSMFDKLGWLTVNQQTFYHTVILVFKIRSNKEPEHLADLLRRSRRIFIPNLDLSIAQNSFSLRGPASWNLLPLSTREQSKISTFKKLAKKWILENVDRFLE